MKKNLYLFFLFCTYINVLYAQISPITADANTVLLDHFDNSTTGESRGGTLSYSESQNGLSAAVNFSNGESYIMYAEPVNLTNKGTVEMWVKLTSYSKGLVNINWFNSSSYPSSGHVFHLRVDDTGKIYLGGWGNPVNSITSNTSIPLNSWTHLAVSWGDSTKIYINGKVDVVSALLFRPAVYMSTNYVYLPYWGEACGYIDEFHISSTQRTNAEIASRVIDHTPPPVVSKVNFHQILVASGGTLSGNNGLSAYSVGQMVFNSFISKSGSLLEGIQQPVEIYFTGFDQIQLQTETLIYPNPTDNYLIIRINQDIARIPLFYELYDSYGKLLKKGKITDQQTKLELKGFTPSCYILEIRNKDSQVKTYKIIKK